MVRALVRVVLIIVIVVAAAAFFTGYRWGRPHAPAPTAASAARPATPVGTSGTREDSARERARAAAVHLLLVQRRRFGSSAAVHHGHPLEQARPLGQMTREALGC